MSLITCKECGHKISPKAAVCPECGEPFLIKKEQQKSIKALKEKISPITIIIYIVLFISLLIIVSSDLIFLKTIRGELTLQQVQFSDIYHPLIIYLPTIIINMSFICSVLNILSRKLYKLSKIGYLLNILTLIITYIIIYNENLRIGPCYYILFLINTLFLIAPHLSKLVEEDQENKNEEKIQKTNKKKQELYEEKIITKKNILTISIILVLEIFSILTIYIVNQKDIYQETIIQANSEFQIKIINNYINIREFNNTDSEIIGVVSKGDIYNVLDVIGTENYIWYKISYKNQVGYIASSREKPYIEELYANKLVVNIFCTEKEDDCAYLLEFISKYQKTSKTKFLINYLDIRDEHDKDIYNRLLDYYDDESKLPYIIIGDKKISGYKKTSNLTIIGTIAEEKDNKINYVDLLKKGEELPKLEK